MNILYAPWRSSYAGKSHENKAKDTQEKCVFCIENDIADDKRKFILKRGKKAFIMLNGYPYNAGHLLVVPYAHGDDLSGLDTQTHNELMAMMSSATQALKKTFSLTGINVGLNIGKLAGGSIPDHLHFHVLPRFIGDTNFLPLLSDTKVVSFDLQDIYDKLKPHFQD